MALDDLDLEFEDEEESKRKKNEALQPDVDLEFHVPESVARSKPTRPGGSIPTPTHAAQTVQANAQGQVPPRPVAEVKKLDDARTQQMKRPPGAGAAAAAPRPMTDTSVPRVAGANALKPGMSLPSDLDELESTEVVELRERVQKVEFEAEVKVKVAEFKAEFIGEMLGDMKLMEHQVNQLLVRINAKHPDLKQEVLMIKKILADYTTKKRK